MRVGQGFDAHRFGGDGPLVLGGVTIADAPGVAATSDGDVVAHALIDAMLGAAALGDLGTFYPSSDARFDGVASVDVLLADARSRVLQAGFVVGSVDITVIAETVRVGPYRAAMRRRLAAALAIDEAKVSVKATSTDGMGAIGDGMGIAALAVVVLASVEKG